MVSLVEHLKKASKAQKEKHKNKLSGWGKKSAQKRLGNMTQEEKSEYFRKIRAGQKVK